MASWSQLEVNDAVSHFMESFLYLHDFIMMFLVLILSVVSVVLVLSFSNKQLDKQFLENQSLESVWTILPVLVLFFIELPSLIILYEMEEEEEWSILLKTIGHQWYWSYEYLSEYSQVVKFDSYMIPEESLENDQFRLLEVDNRIVLPFMVPIKVIVTSGDVLHSWTVPSLGVKADACPGRLNQLMFKARRAGVFYGQCSEICGANHSFMPICLEVVDMENFIEWNYSLGLEANF